MLDDILKEKKCFKLVCAAGNEDCEEVKKLVKLYSLAGCNFFDLSANKNVIQSAKEGLKLAGIDKDRYLCVSIGTKGDPHTNKAYITNVCTNCGLCKKACFEGAIKEYKVKEEKCIGCAKCSKICPKNAIEMRYQNKDINEILPSIINLGIDCIELHVSSYNEEEIFEKWNIVKKLYSGMLSICVDRSKLSDISLVNRLTKMLKGRKPYTTIVQADGNPMSGSKDDYKTTLQAIATAQIVQNADLEVFLLLSGGTNSKTPELARMCEINYNGISVGSWARKIVREYTKREDFLVNKEIFNKALKIAKKLVDKCIE